MDTRWKGLLVVRCLIFIFQSSKCDASTFGSHSEGRSWSPTSQPASRQGRFFWSLPGHNDVSSHVSGHEAACSPGDEEATCSPASRYNTTLHNAMQYLDTMHYTAGTAPCPGGATTSATPSTVRGASPSLASTRRTTTTSAWRRPGAAGWAGTCCPGPGRCRR